MSVEIVVRLTRSQQMALIDILVAYSMTDGYVQEFIDVSTGATTTPGDLLRIVGRLREPEEDDESAAT